MKKPRPQRTGDQVKRDLEVLNYEIGEFIKAALQIGTNPEAENAFVESFAIHARNLILFLTAYQHPNPNYRDDDILAVDAVPGWKCSDELFNYFMPLQDKANKQIAHTTSTRHGLNTPGGPKSDWPVLQLVTKVQAALKDFVQQLEKAGHSIANLGALDGIRRATVEGRTPQATPVPFAASAAPSDKAPIYRCVITASTSSKPEESTHTF
jgi:hypothetical protein